MIARRFHLGVIVWGLMTASLQCASHSVDRQEVRPMEDLVSRAFSAAQLSGLAERPFAKSGRGRSAGKTSGSVLHARRIAKAVSVDYDSRHPFQNSGTRRRKAKGKEAQRRGVQAKLDTGDSYEESDAFQPLRIHYDTYFMDEFEFENPRYQEKIKFVKDEIIPQVRNLWSKALKVFPLGGSIKIDEDGLCPYSNYEQVTSGIDDSDLVIFVAVNEEGICDEGGVLAAAGNCQTDQYDRPTVGFMIICLDHIDLEDEDSRQDYLGNIAHEFTHVLGASSEDLAYFYDPSTGEPRTPRPIQERSTKCVDGVIRNVEMPADNTLRKGTTPRGANYFEVVTPRVRNVVRNHFNCQKMTGARLENQPTAEGDCFGSHWEMRLFMTEFMAAYKTETHQVLSPLTLALLEDSGWYQPDYAVAEISPFGHGAGCDFVYGECVVDGNVPSYSKNTFCNATYDDSPYKCSPTHRYFAKCDLVDYGNLRQYAPDKEFQHFPDPNWGALNTAADYCPTFSLVAQMKDGTEIDCTDPRLSSIAPAGTFGKNSKCFNTDDEHPLCLQTNCNEEKHAVEVIVDGNIMTCKHEGEMIGVPGVPNVHFECPSLALVCPDLICPANCAGRGFCNYNLKDPKCECFDPNDASPMCTGNSKDSQNSASKESGQGYAQIPEKIPFSPRETGAATSSRISSNPVLSFAAFVLSLALITSSF